MAMLRYSSATVVEPHVSSEQWTKSVCCGHKGGCICGGKNCRTKVARTILAKYSPEKYLLSHSTIIAAVDVDEAKNSKSKYKDYLIKPEYSKFVNNNGDAWTKKMLAASYRTFIGANNYCFAAGTRILMADGTYRNIESIQKGDRVINRKGEIDTVTETFCRESDEIVEIKSTNILSRSLFVTKNHPFWLYHARETCPKTGRPNSFNPEKDYCHLDKWVGFSIGSHRKAGEIFPSGLTPEWRTADEIDIKRDFLTHPVPNIENEDEEINANRAELIGWFLAEGSYSAQNTFRVGDCGIVFNLGNNEADVAERLSKLLVEEFGQYLRIDCKPRLYETESGSLCLSLCNQVVADYFKKWCSKYAWAKKLPEKALWFPKNLQAIILKSCLNGDGCGTITSRGYILEMKSQALIQQLLLISWRLGLSPTYKETGVLSRYSECSDVDGYEVYSDPETGKKSRPGYMIRFSTRDSKRLNDLLKVSDERISQRISKRFTHIFQKDGNSWILSKIDSIEPVHAKCSVYNLEVENDNSYIAEGVIVHNCEHVQIPELSKGKVIDAVLREVPIGKDKFGKDLTTYYCDILVATDRKHKDLVAKIEGGQTSSLSMGCKIAFSQCTKCGNIAVDETQACPCVRYEKNNVFYDEQGNQRKIAELCGHHTQEDSVTFVDASWVANPAFTGAVVRNIINPPENIMAKIREAEKKKAYEYEEGDFLKAAHKTAQQAPITEEAGPTDTPPTEDTTAPAEGDAPAEGETPEETPAETPPQEEPEDPVVTWKNKIKTKLLDELGNQILQEFSGESENTGPRELETLDENLIQPTAALKQVWKMKKSWDKYLAKVAGNLDTKNFDKLRFGSYMILTSKDLTVLKDYGYNRRDFLAVMSFLDQCYKSPLSKEVKKAIAIVGCSKGKTVNQLSNELDKQAGRKLTASEGARALAWLRLMDFYADHN